MKRRVSGLGIGLLVLCLAAVVAWPWERAYLQAVAILRALEHKPVPLLCAGVALHDIRVRTIAIPPSDAHGASSPLKGYLYEPTNVANPRAIVLVPGVHRLGIDEPRLTTFATGLAQSGFRVLTPNLPSLANYRVSADAVANIQSAVTWMSQQDNSQVGLIGFSFAGGLALLAAANPATRPHVAWVWSIGGHAYMERVAEYYMTGKATGADGSTFTETPHEYGSLVLVYAHPQDFVPAADVALLLPLLQAHLYQDGGLEDTLAARLPAAKLAEWKALLATSSEDFRNRAQASLAAHAAEMNAVSPEGNVAQLHAPVFLLHGAGDNVIPPTELTWLVKDLPAGDVRAKLVSTAISHVSLDRQSSWMGTLRLVRYFAIVLHFAETR